MRNALFPRWALIITILACHLVLGDSVAAQVIRSGVGADAASIQAAVDAFRADLGVNNGLGPCLAGPCTPGIGRREINWDAVPDAFSSEGGTPFPGNFFNLVAGSPAGRVRGAQFSTTGSFEVSADADSNNDGNPGPVAILFGNRMADNALDFEAFSPERIFGLVGTNQMDVTFSVPGTPGAAATVRGFGAVFTDVEVANGTKLDFFDSSNNLLASEAVPQFVFTGADSFKSFSFLGVSFANPVVARVQITNGGYDLNLVRFGVDDAAAMDDFIYGEPVVIPEPGWPFLLSTLGASLVGCRRRK